MAHRLAEGAHDAALDALSELATEGKVVSPDALVLEITGIPVPVSLAGLTSTQEVSRILRQHVLVRMGRAQEVVSAPCSPCSPLMMARSTMGPRWCCAAGGRRPRRPGRETRGDARPSWRARAGVHSAPCGG